MNDDKRLLIEVLQGFPGSFPKRPEVRLTEVFHEDETEGRIVADQPGSRDIDLGEKGRNVGVVCVLNTLRVVVNQDGRILMVPLQAGKCTIRSPPRKGKKP